MSCSQVEVESIRKQAAATLLKAAEDGSLQEVLSQSNGQADNLAGKKPLKIGRVPRNWVNPHLHIAYRLSDFL